MLRAWSTLAGALLSSSPARLVLLHGPLLLQSLESRMTSRGACMSTCCPRTIISRYEGKMVKSLSKPQGLYLRLTQTANTTRVHRPISQKQLPCSEAREVPPWPTFTTPPCKGPTGRPELTTPTTSPDAYAAYVEGSHILGRTYGTLDRTAELLAKLLSGCEDPHVTALFEAVRALLGLTEPPTKPAMASPSQGLT